MSFKIINIVLLIFLFGISYGQQATCYAKSKIIKVYSISLKDSVSIELTLPLNYENEDNLPVIYVLDMQNSMNYKYNLSTIDYLSYFSVMPRSIVVGIEFNYKNRIPWTSPNLEGGKADDFSEFIINELDSLIGITEKRTDFNVLIGHSRTAIFAQYALSKYYNFFNASIASCTAYFDFDKENQKNEFEKFIMKSGELGSKRFLIYSSGTKINGDLHENSVDKFHYFIENKELQGNIKTLYIKENNDHNSVPGLTVNRGLNFIFKDYQSCYWKIDNLLNSIDDIKVFPWDKIDEIYSKATLDLGFKITYDELFFNSIGSRFYFGEEENSKELAIEVLEKAIENYPMDFGYYYWVGEVYLELNRDELAEGFLIKALQIIEENKALSAKIKTDEREYINELLKKVNK